MKFSGKIEDGTSNESLTLKGQEFCIRNKTTYTGKGGSST